MYLGRIVEVASDRDIYSAPLHPYTELLLASVPSLDPRERRGRMTVGGEIPSPLNPPSGCPFHTRCPKRMDVCSVHRPALQVLPEGRRVACHLYGVTDADAVSARH
jgi:oligopeptide/dipeptide ABC transporter ATP-binding protein